MNYYPGGRIWCEPASSREHSRGLELYSLGMRAKRAEARKKALATNTGFWPDPSEVTLCCFQRYISRKHVHKLYLTRNEDKHRKRPVYCLSALSFP